MLVPPGCSKGLQEQSFDFLEITEDPNYSFMNWFCHHKNMVKRADNFTQVLIENRVSRTYFEMDIIVLGV